MSELDVLRDIGRLEAKVESLEAEVSELKTDVKAIREMLSEARGGWKVIVMIAGASAASGALLTKLLTFLSKG